MPYFWAIECRRCGIQNVVPGDAGGFTDDVDDCPKCNQSLWKSIGSRRAEVAPPLEEIV